MTSLFLKAFNLFYETTEIYLNSQHIGNIIFGIYCSSTKIYEIIGANLGSSVSKATSLELGIAGCLGIHCMDLLALSTPLTSKTLAISLFYSVWQNAVVSIHPELKAIYY